jgi:hypothetical protein
MQLRIENESILATSRQVLDPRNALYEKPSSSIILNIVLL